MKNVNTLSINDFDEPVQVIFREMCRRVGADPEKINFASQGKREDEWFAQATWTLQEEDDFIEWFVNYLHRNSKARKRFVVMGRSKKACKKKGDLMRLYCWNYTKTQDDESN